MGFCGCFLYGAGLTGLAFPRIPAAKTSLARLIQRSTFPAARKMPGERSFPIAAVIFRAISAAKVRFSPSHQPKHTFPHSRMVRENRYHCQAGNFRSFPQRSSAFLARPTADISPSLPKLKRNIPPLNRHFLYHLRSRSVAFLLSLQKAHPAAPGETGRAGIPFQQAFLYYLRSGSTAHRHSRYTKEDAIQK